MPTVSPSGARYHSLLTKAMKRAATATSVTSTPAVKVPMRWRRRLRAASARPSLRMSITRTVTLSAPPAERAAETSLSAAACGLALETASSSISASSIIDERPSEHRMMRSPLWTSSVKWSAYISGSEPSARVMTERDGCTRASSSVISPASTSSSTKEWSWVTRTRRPSWSR